MPEQTERESASRRLCPYCEDDFDSQGLYMHVRNTPGNGHADRGEVPDGFNPREAPIYDPDADNETIETDLTGESQEMDAQGKKKLYRCLWCGEDQKGKAALSIHLTKSAGDELHPEDASTEDNHFFTVPADENWNPIVGEEKMSEIERKELRDRRVREQFGTSNYEVVKESNNMQSSQGLTSAEVEQRRQEIVIPQDATKVEQVAAVLTQEERFYDHPDIVTDMVNASRTTFYEGRKLFDNTGGIDVGGQEAPDSNESVAEATSEAQEGVTVMVGDQKFVPFEALQEVAEATSEAAKEIVARYS